MHFLFLFERDKCVPQKVTPSSTNPITRARRNDTRMPHQRRRCRVSPVIAAAVPASAGRTGEFFRPYDSASSSYCGFGFPGAPPPPTTRRHTEQNGHNNNIIAAIFVPPCPEEIFNFFFVVFPDGRHTVGATTAAAHPSSLYHN